MLIGSECTGKLAACSPVASRFTDRAVEAEVCLADFLTVLPQNNLLGAFAIVLREDAPSMVLMPLCDESLADKFDRDPDMKASSCRDHVCEVLRFGFVCMQRPPRSAVILYTQANSSVAEITRASPGTRNNQNHPVAPRPRWAEPSENGTSAARCFHFGSL